VLNDPSNWIVMMSLNNC